jgi:hypothetical protein
MLAQASARYDAPLDVGEARNGKAILLSDFGKSHSSTEYLTHPISRKSDGLADPDIQDDTSRRSDFEVAGWRYGAILGAVSALLVFLINLSVTIWVGVELSIVVCKSSSETT